MPRSLGFYYEVNYDLDGYVGMDDWGILGTGLVGPALPKPPGCTAGQFAAADLDNDSDVELADVAVFQRLFDE
jgi:hypothetical protein